VPLAMEVVEDLALLAQARDIDLGAELSGPAPVAGHRGLLQALIANLAENAIRYTGSGGHVTVAVSAHGDSVAIVREIADAHHGEIALKPGEGGKGVHVTVSFPRAPTERPQAG
jgi:two-component system sensor histidine kinase TctE